MTENSESASGIIEAAKQEVAEAFNDPKTLVLINISGDKLKNLPNDLKDLGVIYNNSLTIHEKKEQEEQELQRSVLLPSGTPREVANNIRIWLEDQTGEQGFRITIKPGL